MKDVREIGFEFLRSGGKRLRPKLCEAVYGRLKPDGADDLGPLLEALECFHKASLIHDDIQDGDESRYGRPTVWCEYGVPVAIAAGDWLLARGIDLIDRAPFPNVAEMARLRSRAILALCEGQGDELTQSADYVAICERKTGSLFALAAGLGALAAGVDPEPYWKWGETFGVLFQIRDDLRDGSTRPGLAELETRYANRLSAQGMSPFLP